MKKILLFSRDPGGANTVIPLLKPLKAQGYEVALWGKDTALKKYEAAGLKGSDIMEAIDEVSLKSMGEFLSMQSPDLVITGTSAEDFADKYMWKAAEILGIPSFVILDQWINYGIRFSGYPYSRVEDFLKNKEYVYLPTKIFVMDELARKEALADGLPESKLFVTGQPHLQVLMEQKRMDHQRLDQVREDLGAGNNDILMVFASEPITESSGGKMPAHGYTEQTILPQLIEALKMNAALTAHNIILVIRPHPRENVDKFKNWTQLSTPNLQVMASNKHNSEELIQSADCICGMSSMFLLESALLGTPIISIEIGLKGPSLFILDRNQMVKSVKDSGQLEAILKKVVIDKEFQSPPLSFIKDPITRIMAQVGDCLKPARREAGKTV